jgi:hypothetical protein
MNKFEVLAETTIWDCGYNVPNHTYLEKSGKIFAYIQNGRGLPPVYFNKPMTFSKKGRKFVKLKGMPFNLSMVNIA